MDAPRILVLGASGQIGWELCRSLACLGHVTAMGRCEADLAKADSIRNVMRNTVPTVVINAAAYTAVDQAETEPEIATAVNATAPGILAEEARRLGSLLIHYSTDYVFDGTKQSAYLETDDPNPLNVYGQTKLAGDLAIEGVGGTYLIFRTSWIYGPRGKNFLLTMLDLARKGSELRIVNDQIGAPTPSITVAQATAAVLARISGPAGLSLNGRSGVYNLTTAGETSWYEFARAILGRAAAASAYTIPKLIPIPSREYKLPAKRPANSRLSGKKLADAFRLTLPHWEDALSLVMEAVVERAGQARWFRMCN